MWNKVYSTRSLGNENLCLPSIVSDISHYFTVVQLSELAKLPNLFESMLYHGVF